MDLAVYAAIAAIGALGGVFAGLLGIGGGLIMTPLMLFVFEHLGYAPGAAALAAITTNLAAIFFTSTAGVAVHWLHGSIDWRLLAWLAPATLAAAAAAAQVALLVPPVLLIGLFLLLLLYSCWRLLAAGRASAAPGPYPGPAYALGTGAAAGLLGSATGTGGGMIVTPLLERRGVPLIRCVGTSAGNVMLVAVSATLSYGVERLDWRIVAVLAPSCLLASAVGARLANRMRQRLLRMIYAGALMLMVLRLLHWHWIQLTA